MKSTHGGLNDRFNSSLKCLTEREAEVIKLRFGPGGEPRLTAEKTTEILHIGRERVRKIEDKAFKKPRNLHPPAKS